MNTTDVDEIIKRVQEHTRMIYFESPSSQKFEMIDLQKDVYKRQIQFYQKGSRNGIALLRMAMLQ